MLKHLLELLATPLQSLGAQRPHPVFWTRIATATDRPPCTVHYDTWRAWTIADHKHTETNKHSAEHSIQNTLRKHAQLLYGVLTCYYNENRILKLAYGLVLHSF